MPPGHAHAERLGNPIAVDGVIGVVVSILDRVLVEMSERDLPSAKINLVQSAFVDDFVGIHSVIFLRVSQKMLRARNHSAFLQTANILSGKSARQNGVFAKIIVVSAATRIPLQVHCGAIQNMNALGISARFTGKLGGDSAHKVASQARY